MTRIANPPRDSRQRSNAQASPELETGTAKRAAGAHYRESGAGMGGSAFTRAPARRASGGR